MLGSVCTGPWTELGKWDEKGKENPTKANKTPKKQYQNAFSVESSWLNLYVFSIKVDIMLAKVHRTTKWTWKRPQKQKRRKRKNRRWQPMKAINFNSVSSPFPKRQTQWAVQRARRGQLQMGYGFRTFWYPLSCLNGCIEFLDRLHRYLAKQGCEKIKILMLNWIFNHIITIYIFIIEIALQISFI